MAMVNVGIVRMRMFEAGVPVRMAVRFAGRIVRRVFVLVMLVVRMFVLVRHWLVNVLVLVNLRYVQPDANSHKKTRS
jgi:hypothetical protein